MDRSLLILVDRNANGRKRGRCCGRPKRLRPAGRAAYSRICPETQEIRRIASPAMGPGTVLALLPPPLAGEGWGGGPLPTRFAGRPRIGPGAGSPPQGGEVKRACGYSPTSPSGDVVGQQGSFPAACPRARQPALSAPRSPRGRAVRSLLPPRTPRA